MVFRGEDWRLTEPEGGVEHSSALWAAVGEGRRERERERAARRVQVRRMAASGMGTREGGSVVCFICACVGDARPYALNALDGQACWRC